MSITERKMRNLVFILFPLAVASISSFKTAHQSYSWKEASRETIFTPFISIISSIEKSMMHDDSHPAIEELQNIPDKNKLKKKTLINLRFLEGFFKNILMIFVADPDTLQTIAKVCTWVTWTFIFLSALGTFGFDTKPLLSLLSVFGLTVGFAAKDVLTNIFKGFYILLTKPFKRGWVISVNGYRGKILSIDSRFVKLSSLIDKSEILVPLSMIYDTAIVVEKKTEL